MGLMCWAGYTTLRQPTDVAQRSLRRPCTVSVLHWNTVWAYGGSLTGTKKAL